MFDFYYRSFMYDVFDLSIVCNGTERSLDLDKLVQEVLDENKPRERGIREEWERGVGIGRTYDARLRGSRITKL